MKPSKDKDQKETELEESLLRCEECNAICALESLYDGLCDSCYEYNFCECGNRLEDSYGSPGDGFCICCR